MNAHEINRAFDAAHLPLCRKLREMLDEHPSHRTVRRGCGLTQTTRFLSVYVNAPRDPFECEELGMFEDWRHRKRATEFAHQAHERGWPSGWRGTARMPDPIRHALAGHPELETLTTLDATLPSLDKDLELPESRIVLDLMKDLLLHSDGMERDLPGMPQKPEIGSCSQAEEFFLEIAHEKVRRGGSVNVITDGQGRASMIEKVNLGESHSAIVLRPCRLHGVQLVPGSLLALAYPEPLDAWPRHEHGHVLPASALSGVHYMRLTTLGLPPAMRKRAFSTQFERQLSSNMLSPHSTRIEDLIDTADKLVASAG